MRNVLLTVLMTCAFATPVLSAQDVYLKEGGVIRAKSVWQTKGTVHVLVNRDTLAEFATSEIDMKRTFARKRRAHQKQPAIPQPQQYETGSPVQPVTVEKKSTTASGLKLPSLPNLPERNPESLIPSDKAGSIREHKKKMAEKLAE